MSCVIPKGGKFKFKIQWVIADWAKINLIISQWQMSYSGANYFNNIGDGSEDR